MAAQARNKTKYPGVYWVAGKSTTGRPVKRFYIVFKRGGKVYEESARVLVDEGPETRPAESAQEASAWRVRRIAEVVVPAESYPTCTIHDLWLKWSEDKKKSGGYQATESRYRNHIKPAFGDKSPETICDFDIERFRRDMEGADLAPATVKLSMALLSTLMKWGTENGLTQPSALKFRFPSVDNEKTESMSAEQLAAYWRALDEEPDQHIADFFRIMLLTGIRKTALVSLEWTDIDLERGFVTLRGVTAKSKRTKTVPLPAQAIEIFRKMPSNSAFVWPGKKGPLTSMPIAAARIRDRAGLPKDFRPCHGLRHTFASCLASSGQVDLYTLQQLLTHGDAAMTQRYAHLSSEALARAAAVAGQVLSPGTIKMVGK